MSLNSSVQHLSSGLGAFVGGAIIVRRPDGVLARYDLVGLIAVAATLVSIALAARLRPHEPGAATSAGFEPSHDLGVDPAPAAALEMPPSAEIDVPPSVAEWE